jgi:hypothetical protein
MGAESEAIVKHIEHEREELGRNIEALESIVKAEPEKLKQKAILWYEDLLPKAVLGALGLAFLIGFLVTDRRRKHHPRY